MTRPTCTTGSRLRLWTERLVLLLAAALMLQTWCLEGLTVPCPVASGSMAETLLGLHREVTCGDCGHRFVCGSDIRPLSPRAVCPNCGYAGNDLDARPDLAGDRVLIDKATFQFRRPRRWEVVALRDPDHAGRTLVKRVVGLPGESVQVRHGDVYVDGKIQRKTLPQQRAVAILVHDANCRPKIEPVPAPRWQAGSRSQWVADGGRFTYPRGARAEGGIDWLEYCHWRRVPDRAGEVREVPITDICGYNQTRPRREEEVRPVGDVLLSLRLVKTWGRGRLVVRATDGREEFQVRIDPGQGRYDVVRGGRPAAGAAGEVPSDSDELAVEVSLFDGQFLVAFDGQTAVAIAYDPSLPARPTSRPLAVAAEGGLGVEVGDLRVYRDVYYTHPIGLYGRWGLDNPVRLADDEYFVTGDNSPVSEDSRSWPGGPAVAARLLVGRPLIVHSPARLVELGWWRFQVPDPGRIRYIR